jgi:hypothetical protein
LRLRTFEFEYCRHGRACPGHPRIWRVQESKTWMPGTSPGMTDG